MLLPAACLEFHGHPPSGRRRARALAPALLLLACGSSPALRSRRAVSSTAAIFDRGGGTTFGRSPAALLALACSGPFGRSVLKMPVVCRLQQHRRGILRLLLRSLRRSFPGAIPANQPRRCWRRARRRPAGRRSLVSPSCCFLSPAPPTFTSAGSSRGCSHGCTFRSPAHLSPQPRRRHTCQRRTSAAAGRPPPSSQRPPAASPSDPRLLRDARRHVLRPPLPTARRIVEPHEREPSRRAARVGARRHHHASRIRKRHLRRRRHVIAEARAHRQRAARPARRGGRRCGRGEGARIELWDCRGVAVVVPEEDGG